MTCPFCGFVSHNPNDALHRYCVRCHVFVDDVIAASPAVRRAMGRFCRALAVRVTPGDGDRAERLLRTAAAWEAIRAG
jgi:hypothetical protein